ncbi:MAG: cache domain-containing protein [Bryobacteraceae bacterium]|nr:cache domain-containing protein [Bryobacteraceae bacterium]MDW8379941.1 cache domain-containing protein [Bryobacterales bacterium]
MFRSYRTKLQVAFLFLGSLAIAITGWEAWAGARAALQRATADRLVAIRQTRARQIERYFEDLLNHVLALSSDESTIGALEEFEQAWKTLPPLSEAADSALQAYYREFFRTVPSDEKVADWIPREAAARSLQYFYIAQNPYPPGTKDRLLEVPGAGRYGVIHARYHPTLHRYQSAFGFYDIFLIDASGRVLYTVSKEIDLGASIGQAPYSRTGLGRVFRRALALPEPEQAVVEDYARYLPSHEAPAAFVAAPVWRGGEKIGVLAIQISIAEINRVMTGNQHWKEEGLGETGQAYIVGSEGALRSDFRQYIEKPEDFVKALREAQFDRGWIARIQANRTAVLVLRIFDAVNELREPWFGEAKNLLGAKVLRASTPLAVAGLDWTLVAEINVAEAFAPVDDLRKSILGYGILVAGAFFLAASALARRVTQPVLQLTESARRMGARDFRARTSVAADDELGQLAATLNQMAEDLEKTTVSKEEVDRILSSLINAVFVVEVELAATVDELFRSPIREANPAASALLGVAPEVLRGKLLGEFLPEADWRPHLEQLYHERRLATVEAALRRSDGSQVPVFFTASYLSAEPNRRPGIVCAAQDITEYRKATLALQDKQRELERLAGRLLAAQEEERKRVARELHDDITQRLAAVAIDLGRLQTAVGDEQMRRNLEALKQTLARISTDVHGLSRRLHPSWLDDLGLAAAIAAECRSSFERGGPPVDLEMEELPEMSKEVELTLYRVVQEGLRNITKHAQAGQAWVSLRRVGDRIRLEIRDDGSGFDPERRDRGPGLGLASMEERARLLGGIFHVHSKPGEGTSLVVELPARRA